MRTAGTAGTAGSGVGPVLDAEGFQTVGRRGGKGPATAASVPEKRDEGPPARGSHESDRMDEDDPGEGGDAQEQPGEEEGPTVEELHRTWQDEVAFVKKLRQQGVQDGHPAMRAACEARDGAEQAWRAAKEPAPAAIRLGRAQSKLDRAITLQAEARQAVLDEESSHRERMRELQAALDECTTRVANRRRQLREIQGEVGASGGDGGAQSRQREAIRRVHTTICGDVGPTIAALVEQLDTASPAWAALNGLLGKLSASKEVLEGACAPQPGAQEFDLTDDADRWEEASEWSEGQDLRNSDRTDAGDGGQCYATNGRCAGDSGTTGQGGADGSLRSGVQDHEMGVDDWWGTQQRGWKTGTHWHTQGHGQWQRASWADQMEQDLQEEGEADGQPAATRRRVGPADTQRAQEGGGGGPQQQQQPRSPRQGQPQQGTAAGAPGKGTAARGPEEGGRLHAERLGHIINAAIEAGVNPVSAGGEDLHLLTPSQLDAWAAENLPATVQR